MADKRIPTTEATTPIVPPTEQIQSPNQYDSILQRLQELEEQNRVLAKKVAEANGDISAQIKESKRKYGYNMDGTRKEDELFKFGFRTLFDDRKEKVVIKTETIGRPVNFQNTNTGNWTNKHDIKITFHDGTTTEMDILNYINQTVKNEEFVQDSDIKVIDGIKYYTFRTEKFGTFTIAQNFIN